MASRKDMIDKILKGAREFGEGFRDDFGIGKEDTTRMYYRRRDLENKAGEAPRIDSMMGTHPGMFRLKEATGNISNTELQALQESNMELKGSTPRKVGQFGGSLAADVVQDRSRSIYWLLNALQATGEVINEKALSKIAPSLYETSAVKHPTRMTKVKGGKAPKTLQMGNKEDKAYMISQGMIRPNNDGGYSPARGYKFKPGEDGNKELHKRNYSQGMIAATAIPTGIAINSGLGLLTPFGGAEGYKAAIPSEEDPSKTQNVLGEVALKYVMGRTGNLLPYEEFSKVRPDVSPQEYKDYMRFKYDKREDYNPTDGDVTIAAGGLKATTEGIHGPEVQFLGRSLPLTTGIVPYAASLVGGLAGARYGAKSKRAAIGALGGGTAGLVVGQAVGNIIEQERRRRNSVENQLEGGSAETYLG